MRELILRRIRDFSSVTIALLGLLGSNLAQAQSNANLSDGSPVELNAQVTEIFEDGLLCRTLSNDPKQSPEVIYIFGKFGDKYHVGSVYSGQAFSAGSKLAHGVSHAVPTFSLDEFFAFQGRHPLPPASEYIRPPFGFLWGVSERIFVAAVAKVSAAKVEKTEVSKEGAKQVQMSGIMPDRLVVFEFKRDALCKVTLISSPVAESNAAAAFARKRELFENKHGHEDAYRGQNEREIAGAIWRKGKTYVSIRETRESGGMSTIEEAYGIDADQ